MSARTTTLDTAKVPAANSNSEIERPVASSLIRWRGLFADLPWRSVFWREAVSSNTGALILFGLGVVFLQILVNGQYGFHRDELLTFTNAQHLAWGYVVYPPVTAVLGGLN